MEIEPIITDKAFKKLPGTNHNPSEPKKDNLISQNSPAYTFCKSLDELNNKNESGWTPIYKSIMSNNKLALKELIKLGANPNIPNNLGETPLYLSIENDNYDLFKFLLENGANPDTQKRNGDTPLHLIIKTNMENKYVIEILKNKANPNIQNKLYEQTATHLALKNKYGEKLLGCFRKNNADIFNIKDKYDKTPFDYAKELNDEKYIELVNKIFLNKPEKVEKNDNYNSSSYKKNKDIDKEIKVEKKLDFDKQSIESENKEKNNIITTEENKEESKKISEKKNKRDKSKTKSGGKEKESFLDSLSKFDNEILNSVNNEVILISDKDKLLDNFVQKSESKKDSNIPLLNIATERSENEKDNYNNKELSNNNDLNKTMKEKEINLSCLTNRTKEKESGRKEIIITKKKNTFSAEKNIYKEYFNTSGSKNSENDFEKLNYKLFKHLKILNKKKKGEINKNKIKNKSKNKKTNNQTNFYCISIRNNYENEKDISIINNENNFSYEAKETLNESNLNNKSNKENINTNNIVYHSKNYLATKEKNKNKKEKDIPYMINSSRIYANNIYNKQNIFRYSSPDYKFTHKSFNRNNLIQDNNNIFFNEIEYNNTNPNIYNQYKNNNIIISKNKNSCNKFNYEFNSLNNTTFSSVRNNTRNNFKSGINRNSLTSNSFSNNSNVNNSFKNNSSVLINDYYNNNFFNTRYQINSYKLQHNNLLIKFRDWLISCDLLCYYNTLVKHNMYNIDKYINDIKLNKINIITFKNIEEFGIRKPGHIYRLLLKLYIDAGKIDNNIYKFISDRFNINTVSNNAAMTTSVNDLNCFGLNCFLNTNNNSNYNYNNKRNININNNYNESEINYYDIFSFLKVNNLLKFKENFIHNGFDQIDYILIQLFSKYCFDKKILNDYMHIYLEDDKNYILKILYREKKRISNLLGIPYNDDEIKNILSYSQIRSSLNESYININNQNNNNCCSIF